jgi:hypothetical protein
MPDLEELIRSTLDRQAPRPNPDPIVERVARRKRQVRLARRVQSATVAVVVVAGIAAGGYALARAFGVGHRPAPAASSIVPGPASPSFISCGAMSATVAVVSQEGAAGTISTLWRVTNEGSTFCRSDGFPSMAIHTQSGWTTLSLLHGGYPDINKPPHPVVVDPGQSMFFVSYWSDVTTNSGSCEQFDRVRVMLPGASTPLELASAGCLIPDLVRVGPVSASPPSG